MTIMLKTINSLFKQSYLSNCGISRCYAAASTFKASDLKIKKATRKQSKPDWDNLEFGKHFSDHMLTVKWNIKDGWKAPSIHPVENFSMHPAAKVFHYANELFEGMKAYYGVDKRIRLFRPDQNMIRMNNSAIRATLPSFDGEELIKCIKTLIGIDHEWVPRSTTSSLYIRPTMIGVDPSLGVSRPTEVILYVIIGPVGAYYKTGVKPVSLLADPTFVRAWPGGSGMTKMGANYAPTIYVQAQAERRHCQQVLWLYGEEHYITEVGTMNLFVNWINEDGVHEVLTPPLTDGTILPGVTRSSCLQLLKDMDKFAVAEKPCTMKEIVKAVDEGRLKEVFGVGTACVVSPVSRILYEDRELDIPCFQNADSVTYRLLKEVTDIQYGRIETKHDWIQFVNFEEMGDKKRVV